MSRILHLRSSCGLYGADRALLDLAGATRAPLEAVVGSIVRGDRDELGDEAERRGLAHWRIQSDGKADFAAADALALKMEQEGIGLVHAHDYKSLAIGLLAARRARIPVVATYHGDTGATPALIAYEALARGLGNFTAGVAAVSAPLARKLARWIHAVQIQQIPNGISIQPPCSLHERRAARAELGIPDDARVVAIVGRLSVEKGHATLLDAVRTMPTQPTLLVAGDGALKAELYDRARGLDVNWLGFVGNTRRVYAAADVIAMPSLTEGLPLVALETMAAGRPLVASAVGELPTMLANGAGLLVSPGDAAGLAAALSTALQGGELIEQMTSNAVQTVRREYALETMAERYAQSLYEPALARSPSRRAVLQAAGDASR